jgi:segregation and condensation protein B
MSEKPPTPPEDFLPGQDAERFISVYPRVVETAEVDSEECTDVPDTSNVIVLPGVCNAELEELEGSDELLEDLSETLEPPPDHLINGAVEALLLVAEGPVTTRQLDGWLGEPGTDLVHTALKAIEQRYRLSECGFLLVQVAKGWQLRTDIRFARWVGVMKGTKPLRLSKAALETLAVVAYRQPVTRAEIQELRGVESGGVVRMLCERSLLTTTGRKSEPGRPLLYGTTPQFLSLFHLRDLAELPALRDLREMQRDDPECSPVQQLLPIERPVPPKLVPGPERTPEA